MGKRTKKSVQEGDLIRVPDYEGVWEVEDVLSSQLYCWNGEDTYIWVFLTDVWSIVESI